MDAMTSDENRLVLHNTPKTLQGAIPRAVAPVQTLARLRPLMPQAGISHLVDLTGLDDLGLPVYLAFGPLPASADLSSFARRMQADPGPQIERLLQSVEVFPPGAPPAGETGDASRSDGRMLFSAGKGVTALDARVSALILGRNDRVTRRRRTRPPLSRTRPPLAFTPWFGD